MTIISNIPDVRPTVLMDFANSESVHPAVITHRDNVATYIDNNGLMRLALNNTPRITYDPVTLECLGLLIEGDRYNEFSFSEDMAESVWEKTSVTVSSSDLNVGLFNPQVLTEMPVINEHSLSRSIDLQYAESVTIQAFLMAKTTSFVCVYFLDGETDIGSIKLDLRTGEWLSGSTIIPIKWVVTPHKSGLIHVAAIIENRSALTSLSFHVSLSPEETLDAVAPIPANAPYMGNNGSIYIAGMQLTRGSNITSYIPKKGHGAGQRIADFVYLNDESLILPEAFTIIADHVLQENIPRESEGWSTTLYSVEDYGGNFHWQIVSTSDGKNYAYDENYSVDTQENEYRRRSGLSVTNNSLQLAINGTVLSPYSMPATSFSGNARLFLSNAPEVAITVFNGTIKRLCIYPRAFTQEELAQTTRLG